jgi:FdrA protein
MTVHRVGIRPNTYVDSVFLMSATRTMEQSQGVLWAAALMGTLSNLDSLVEQGFDEAELQEAARSAVGSREGVEANDLVLAVRAGSEEEADTALGAGLKALTERAQAEEGRAERRPRTLEEAIEGLQDANLALISVPWPFAGLEAEKALSAGLHVLVFSDNVSLETEVALKKRAYGLGLLLMGPGAGTAMLGDTGLGFANVVRTGSVGVVAAAGTGAQEAMTLLHRWGAGVSGVIGLGGRDLSESVGATMARAACNAFLADPGTEVILLVSKPPSESVARSLFKELVGKPVVACLVGFDGTAGLGSVMVASTIEAACAGAIRILGMAAPDASSGPAQAVLEATAQRRPGRRAIRGFFSGGTLCYEAMTVMTPRVGPIFSNVPLQPELSVTSLPPGAHVCLDLGEEEFTKGRPHPMIDPEPRAELIAEEAFHPETAVILVDVILGYGAHPDPASVLAPACAKAATRPDGASVVAYVLGTDLDPQDYAGQSRQMEEAGCILAPTSATAALMAAAIAAGNPDIVGEAP